MKKKDLTSLKCKSITELTALAADLRKQIIFARMELAVRKNKNTNISANLKRSLAQILSTKREKELTKE